MIDFEIVYHPKFEYLHRLDYVKPTFEVYENPLRCAIPMRYLVHEKLVSRQFYKSNENNWESHTRNFQMVKPVALKEKDILLIHTLNHVERVKYFASMGSGQIGNLVLASPDIWDIALLSAGCVYRAFYDVIKGYSKVAFSFNRPPGHHAISEESDGLCVFNNVAIAIAKIRKALSFSGKIAIIDIDDHFGDGLSKIFYEDPAVLYSSIHEFSYTQGEEGSGAQMGANEGRGTNYEFPVPVTAGDDFLGLYQSSMERVLETYKPDLIVVALGVDGHWMDPIGNLNYTMKGYLNFFRWLRKVAARYTGGKVIIEFEGGYNYYTIAKVIELMIYTFSRSKTGGKGNDKNIIERQFDGFVHNLFSNTRKSLNNLPDLARTFNKYQIREKMLIELLKMNKNIS